jgi:hypothetical protein
MTRPALVLAASLLVAAAARAQHNMADMAPPAPTAKALQQIEQVKQASQAFATPDQAKSAGFGPVLNWLPTMGIHWVNLGRRQDGHSVTITAPDQLMFSPVNGKDQLVGAAYSFIVPLSDSSRPPTFDGNPAWHDHPQFAPEGSTLAMLHVWFVPSPDGPFAGHNPNLPFWALGLTPPPAERFKDAAESARIRKVALALGVVADTAGLFPTLAQRPEVHAALATEREAIRALVPKLDAKSVSDWASWDRAADQAAARWDAVRGIYLGSVRTPSIKARMIKVMDEMETGTHAHVH